MALVKKVIAIYLIICVPIGLLASLGVHSKSSDSGSSTGGDTHEPVQVIADWADTLSSGDVKGASNFFAIPSVVANGTPPITLTNRKEVLAFNQGLPCGAKLVKATPDGGLIDATFRLRDRPGGDCGTGVGGLAATAFEIKDGKITQWRRLDTLGAPGAQKPSGPIV